MPGFVIHLATAKEYIRKHNNEIKNKQDFFKGVIAPDMTTKENKKNTHYGNSSSEICLRHYLTQNSIDTDYDKGYFLHLVTDYIFYNKLLTHISKNIYNDYDILNEFLITKYNVVLLDEVKDSVSFKEGNTHILHKEIAEKAIKLSSDCSLYDIQKEILDSEYIEKWEKIRPLIRLD